MKYKLSEPVLVHLYPKDGPGLCLKLYPQRVLKIGLLISLFGLLTLSGSLLFFREIEINRNLHERLMELQNWKSLSQLQISLFQPPTAVESPIPQAVERRLLSTPTVTAKLNDLSLECAQGICQVGLTLIPSTPGSATGSLLLILEANISKIGAAAAEESSYQRYILSPGGKVLEAVDPNGLAAFEKKAFQFSRILETETEFNLKDTYHPIAIHAYVFDATGQVIHHERKAMKESPHEPSY